jgi:choline dehydrogenase-like flavoprotein
MVTQVLMNSNGHTTGVTFVHEGQTYEQKARVVILSNFVVETPRLLLHSANVQFPDGLANSSGWVGKAYMVHSSNDGIWEV